MNPPIEAAARAAPNDMPPPSPTSADRLRVALAAVTDGRTLHREEARGVMGAMMEGSASPTLLAGLLVALHMRGETVEELTGFALAMRERSLRIVAPAGAVDTCGTGGDGRGTFNISTAAAIVVAAAGVPVAKHGNRAVSSGSGSSDVLAALGVTVEQTPGDAAAALAADGFAFLYAPAFHPAMRHAAPTRRELGVRTAFNLLGPLTNPAGLQRQLVGVADPAAAERVARTLQALGVERAFVVHGDRFDELPLDGSGVLYDVSPAGVERRTVTPEHAGLPRAGVDQLLGAEPGESAAIIERVLGGGGGPTRDVVVLNAGAALEVAGRVADLREGVALASQTIDAGAGREMLQRLRARRRERPS